MLSVSLNVKIRERTPLAHVAVRANVTNMPLGGITFL